MRRRPSNQEFARLYISSIETNADETTRGFDRLPPSEQPNGILVHGGLCTPKLPRNKDRILQHVRTTHPKRTMYRLNRKRHQTNEIPCTCFALVTCGICSKKITSCLAISVASKRRIRSSRAHDTFPEKTLRDLHE